MGDSDGLTDGITADYHEETELQKWNFATFQTVVIAIILGSIVLLSIFGNILVCVAVATEERLRKIGNYFLVSLAMADLLVSILVMSFAAVNDLLGHWIFGKPFCTVWISFDIMFSTASILNICAISVDRYTHIKLPFKYYNFMTNKTAVVMIAVVWVLSGLISFVPINLGWHEPFKMEESLSTTPVFQTYDFYRTTELAKVMPSSSPVFQKDSNEAFLKSKTSAREYFWLGFSDAEINDPKIRSSAAEAVTETHTTDLNLQSINASDTYICTMNLNATYAIVSSLVSFFIPCVIMLTIYALIFSAVRTRTQNARKGRFALKSAGGGRKTTPVSESAYHIANQQAVSDRKAAITLGIIMGVFLACWLPFFIYNITLPIFQNITPNATLFRILTWLGYLNSAINPAIYSIFNRDFREAFKYILLRRIFCRKRVRNYSDTYCPSKSVIKRDTRERNGRYSRYHTFDGKRIFSRHTLVDFYSNSSTETVKEKITPT